MRTFSRFILISSVAMIAFAIDLTVAAPALAQLTAPSELRVLKDGEVPEERPATGVKWYPGHYVFIDRRSNSDYLDENNLRLVSAYNDLAPYPIVRGVQVRYIWRELEPGAKGVYRFDKILADADYLQSKGKRLIVQINFKSFAIGQRVVPPYMEAPEYEMGQLAHGAEGDSGWVMRWWVPAVQDRFLAFLKALGDAIDEHPAIALVNINESAVNRPPDTPLWSAWVGAGKSFLGNLGYQMRDYFPNTPTVNYQNAFPDWFPTYEATSNSTGQGVGGPDHAPFAYEDKNWLVPSYDLHRRLNGKVPICLSVQWPNYPTTYDRGGDAELFFHFARNTIGVTHQTWQRRDPYWADVTSLWKSLETRYPGDPAGGLRSVCPELLAPCKK
ncbi:conserved exported hypothetical protein [Thiocapsa sp. KS1]|nr:hypothetical protein [Thiocapsa sp. KS1]CRI62983.1 conserved exported hypothetical protein [Thiocapsa sp. KS1]